MAASPLAAPDLPPPPAPPRVATGLRDVPAGPDRLQSLDIIRGLACVLMAIDHVRVYSGLPAGGPEPGIFLTRWVTHFVAPAFCFFAGTAAYLLGQRLADTGALRRFLVTRGLVLVVLEFTLIRFLWAFHVGPDFMLAGVIWMLGWCMVMLAAMVGLGARRVGWLGMAIVLLAVPIHRLFGLIPPPLASVATFFAPSDVPAPFDIQVLYVLVPWIGVMAAGYGFGLLLEGDAARRRTRLLRLGLGLTLAWPVVVAATGGLAAGADAPVRPLWMRLLDQEKYPASIPFLLMTLGPGIALLPWAERTTAAWTRVLRLFGRVPMWYYLAHLAVIHVASIVVTWLRTGSTHPEWFRTAPYTWMIPEEARWSLPLLYLVWAVCIALLVPACAWYATAKGTRPRAWMRYL